MNSVNVLLGFDMHVYMLVFFVDYMIWIGIIYVDMVNDVYIDLFWKWELPYIESKVLA